MPFIEANGKRLFYTHRTPGAETSNTGITLLMIHGLGSSHSFYIPLFPYLLDAGFSCLAYDTYGSALSTFEDGTQDVNTMAKDALGLMAAFDISPERAVVVGHSMSGMVACQLASQYPFAGAVLLGPVHPTPGVAGVFAKRIETVQNPKSDYGGSEQKEGMEAMADTVPGAATGSKSTPLQESFIRALLLSQQPVGYVSLCKVIAEASPPEYNKVTCPLLIVAGEDDKSAPLQGCQTIFDSCGTDAQAKKIEILKGVGHWHCIEAADTIGPLMESFARKLV
ncbi:hypothetical protein FQN54_000731 [Arachnomyces sp. PD_36]|nr:hypothetical protein FQN54_000731 [Arachnomyces sp. PD_36]